MRDIRGDLQERASLVEQQINAAQNQFEKLMEQLKSEHDSRVIDLKATLNAVSAGLHVHHGPPASAASNHYSAAFECPSLALSGHATGADECLLSGVKRT